MNTLMTLANTDSKHANLLKDNKVIDKKTDQKINKKDFISILFSQIENHSKKSVKEEKKIPINVLSSVKTPIKEEKSKSSNELLLGDILTILTMLKGSDDKISFPKFSDKLDKILKDKSVLNEFKNIKKIQFRLKRDKFYKNIYKNSKKRFSKIRFTKIFQNQNCGYKSYR